MERGVIRVQTKSGLSDVARAAALLAHIEKIANGDPMALYIQRLQEMAENPLDGATGLGLYRIAFEGGFSVSASYEQPTMTIVAERSNFT
jgi:hypothetical protein